MPAATIARPAAKPDQPGKPEHIWRLRICKLEPSDGGKAIGVGTALSGEHAAAGEYKSVRIRFKLTEAEYRKILDSMDSQIASQPVWEVTNSAVIGFEFPPPGSLGFSGVRF